MNDCLNYEATEDTILCGWNSIAYSNDIIDCRPEIIEFWGGWNKETLKQNQACKELEDIAKVLSTGESKRSVKVEFFGVYANYVSFRTPHLRLVFDMESAEFGDIPTAEIFINRGFKNVY